MPLSYIYARLDLCEHQRRFNELFFFEDEGNLPFTNLVVDIENKKLTFTGLIASLSELVLPNVGNVFYSHGIITLTKDTEIGGEKANAFDDFNLSYKSTITIYENEFLSHFTNMDEKKLIKYLIRRKFFKIIKNQN